jgi:hypothetical protein
MHDGREGGRGVSAYDDVAAAPVGLDLVARRAEWQLATLLVALVLVPGSALGDAEVHLGRALRRASAPAPVRRGGRGQPVRPPRSC